MKSETFSERLRHALDGESVNSFAKKCGVSESLLRKYLSGSCPGLDKAASIAKAANVNFEWLATGEGQMRKDDHDGHRDSPQDQDGKLSDVVDRWDELPEKAKTKIHAQVKELTKPTFLNDPKARKFKAHSRGLADFIWDRGCKDAGLPGMFDSKALHYIDKYINKELSDIDLYDAAVSWAKRKLTVIRKVDKRNGNL